MNEVELLVDSGTLLGECPVWDVKENVLYWIDIDGHKIIVTILHLVIMKPGSCLSKQDLLQFESKAVCYWRCLMDFTIMILQTRFWNLESVILSHTGKTIGSMTAAVTQVDVSGWEA